MKLRSIIALALALWPSLTLAQVNPGTSPLSVQKGGTGATTAAGARANLGLTIGANVQAWDADLDCIAAISTSGLITRTGSGTCAARQIVAPAAGIIITNPTGAAGDVTLALANDLAALEGLSGTGIARRTGTDAWSVGATVSAVEGGTGFGSYSQHDIIVADSSTTLAKKSLPDCQDSTGNHLNYTRSTQTFSCGNTSSGGGGGGAVTPPQGRLTLTSGVAVTTSDVTAAGTLYYTPAQGSSIPIAGSMTAFTELSLVLDSNSGHTNYHASGKNYDVFVGISGSNRLCTGPDWAAGAVAGSNSAGGARGSGAGSTELQLSGGIWTNKNSMTCRYGNSSGDTFTCAANACTYVSAVRMTADGQTEDSLTKRFVSNAYNQVPRILKRYESASSWNYSTAAWQQVNANSANAVSVLLGLSGSRVQVQVFGTASSSGSAIVFNGIGLDRTNANDATLNNYGQTSSTAVPPLNAIYSGYPSYGYHAFNWLEYGGGSGTQTFYGLVSQSQAGMTGEVWN